MNDAASAQTVAQCKANAQTLINRIKATSPQSQFALITMSPTNNASRTTLSTFYQVYRDKVGGGHSDIDRCGRLLERTLDIRHSRWRSRNRSRHALQGNPCHGLSDQTNDYRCRLAIARS